MSGDIDTTRTDIERWILSELSPSRSTTAELSYDRMESQSGRCLPVIYRPLDYSKRSHWQDTGLIAAFTEALRGARRVLDIGPGDGWPCLRMARRFEQIVGVDPSPRRVRVQRENAERLHIHNVEFLEMDAVSLDFADRTFGGVAAASSIEQTDDPERALREVFRVLKPGGRLAMVFEDYGEYFPESEGDEELRVEFADGPPALFYQARSKDPARESKYGLFLDDSGVREDNELEDVLIGLERKAVEFENLSDPSQAPSRPDTLDVRFFERLRPLVVDARYFELRHLTSETLDQILEAIGFEDIRHFDHRLPNLRRFFDAAAEDGRLDELASSFEDIAWEFGAEAVRAAEEGPGDFAIATRPAED
ncbi:MAG: methyltransferase domain-containing protein [Candidatus Eisenbacteria bacterium]|nr:methyltransferase domain-containing protein [Candidatus Eisenbacteria bacterium]